MFRFRTTALVLTLIAALGASAATAAESAVRWYSDIDAALAAAGQSNRLVLVHFWRPSCQPCMRLEANVFNQPQFAASLEADYVPVKVNTDQFPVTARRYGIEMLPTDVILTPDGKVAATAPSPQDAIEYANRLRQTAASIRRSSGQFAQADRWAGRDTTRETPANYSQQYAPREQATPPQVTAVPSYGDQPPEGDVDHRYANEFAGRRETTGTGAYDNQPKFADAPRYDAPRYDTPRYDDPRSDTPRYDTTAAAPRSTPPHMTTRDAAPAKAADEPSDNGLPYGNPSAVAGAAATGPRGADFDRGQGNPSRSPAYDLYATAANPTSPPPGNAASAQPSLCLDGNCPVTLMETQRWVPGDRRFGAVHRGRLYLFASTDAQQRFLADPDKYAPAISGHDAVAWVEQGRLVHGERKFGGYYRGFIYLFGSEESLRQFEANPERYAAPVEQAVAASRGQGQVRR